MTILPLVIDNTLSIIVEKINTLEKISRIEIPYREWKDNPVIDDIIRDVSKYMSETYFYPEKYNLFVSEKELSNLLDDLSGENLYNFFLSQINGTVEDREKAHGAFTLFLYNTFWFLYKNNKKMIKNLKLGRK